VASSPVSQILPESGISKPAISRSSVDLPEPDGPSNATREPDSIFKLTRSSAWKLPNCFDTFSTTMPIGRKKEEGRGKKEEGRGKKEGLRRNREEAQEKRQKAKGKSEKC